jgi:hypothetical protein
MREVVKSDVLNVFKEFSKKIDAQLNYSAKSDINSGGAIKYLTISIVKKLDAGKIEINQSFSYLFSQSEELNVQTGLTLIVKKTVRSDFYLHFWQRELIDRIFLKNRLNSGNSDFDKKFSVKSNNPNLTDSIFRYKEIQNLFLTNKFLVFNISCKDRNMEIKLKNMKLKKYDLDEIEHNYQALLILSNMIKN